MWIVETKKKKRWMKKYKTVYQHTTRYHYKVYIPDVDYQRIKRKTFFMKTKWYKRSWDRSNNYRKSFFEYYKAPYRCAYCHKKLSKEELQVDHVIPVARAKNSSFARTLLYFHGIDNVNDARNLVPSCPKCNLNKSSKMGLWYIKGKLGIHAWYWKIKHLILISLFAGIIYFVLTKFLCFNV